MFFLLHRVTDSLVATRGASLISRPRCNVAVIDDAVYTIPAKCIFGGLQSTEHTDLLCKPCAYSTRAAFSSRVKSSCITRRDYPIIGHALALTARLPHLFAAEGTAASCIGSLCSLNRMKKKYRLFALFLLVALYVDWMISIDSIKGWRCELLSIRLQLIYAIRLFRYLYL